jgi:hypothetical protein
MATATRTVKVGTYVNLKNAFSPHGVIKVVVGEGATASYAVSTLDGWVWVFRSDFTIAKG